MNLDLRCKDMGPPVQLSCKSAITSAAVGAKACHHIIDRFRPVFLRKGYLGDRYIFKTESLAATAAIEVDVGVIVVVVRTAVTQLIADTITTVRKDMHQMPLAKQGQGARYHAFIHTLQLCLYLAHR